MEPQKGSQTRSGAARITSAQISSSEESDLLMPAIVVKGWERFHRDWEGIFRAKNKYIMVIFIPIISHRLMISKSVEKNCEPLISITKAKSDEVIKITEQDRRRLETLGSTSGLQVGCSAFPTVVHAPAVPQTEVPAASSQDPTRPAPDFISL